MKTIYNFTNIASHYRETLWAKLLENKSFDFHFLFGKSKKLGINELDFSKPQFLKNKHKLHTIKNIWIKGNVLVFQIGVITKCLFKKIDIAIFLGEFQIISSWIAITICKLRGIKVVIWSHGLYGSEASIKKFLRLTFYKMADEMLLYERRAKKLLIENGFDEHKLKVIFNSLNYDLHKKLRTDIEITQVYQPTFFENNHLPYLIFVGRLTKFKKIDLLLEAIEIINKQHAKVNLILVGEGQEKANLKSIVNSKNLNGSIYFYGASYNEKELAKLIYHAALCVSPGNVGLTAIHSLSYGTPVCTHSNFSNQMPEVESIEEGKTGIFFKEDTTDDLVLSIINWLKLNNNRELIRADCYKIIDTCYNPYYQLEVIKSL